MYEPPQDTGDLGRELLALVAYHSPIAMLSARHKLAQWVGWSVYYPEFKEARGQLIQLDLIEYDPPPGCPSGMIRITDEGFETLARRREGASS